MKKLILLSALLILGCSSNSDDSADITGCTDPNAVNYNPSATQSDGSCQYSFVGDWRAYYYTIDNEDILFIVNYFDISFFDDGTVLIVTEITGGDTFGSSGTYNFDTDTNILYLTADVGGTIESWNVTYFDGDLLDMNLTDVSGYHDTQWARY